MRVHSTQSRTRPPVSTRELTVAAALVAAGGLLRAWDLPGVGLTHFDEGIYALSSLGLTEPDGPRFYAGQFRFSPPLFPTLVAVWLRIFGPSDAAAVMVNILLGTITIALTWWVGRSWFGREAGVAAAALLAFSEFHISLSRTGLTDVAFALLFMVTLAVARVALERGSFNLAVAAGLAAGLTWNTKYHGWFTLLVVAAALPLWLWQHRAEGRSWKRLAFLWIVMAGVAAACYLPWVLFVQSRPGGYLGLTLYQRTLISGEWLSNLWRQAQLQFLFEGPFSRASIPFALGCAALVSPDRPRPERKSLTIIALLAAGALLLGGAGTMVLLALVAIPQLLRRRESLVAWLAIGWLGLFLLTTPLYYPYARLLLPFMLASCLASGLWIAQLLQQSAPAPEVPLIRRLVPAAVAAILVGILAAVLPDATDPWRRSRSVAEAAMAMLPLIPPGQRVVVIGEPALAFHLHRSGRPAFDRILRIQELEELDQPVFVVTGLYSKQAPALQKGLQALGDRLSRLATLPMQPSEIRVFDDFPPRKARQYLERPDDSYELILYRFTPQPGARSPAGGSSDR